MKFKLLSLYKLALCVVLTTNAGLSLGKPLDYEDVADLLPEIPRNKNDTMAAIVQDPVVQDAVHHAASNTSLNGLVVKKRVFIMPATNPRKVLSHREQVLVVPTEHLEDVRRNITEAKQAEIESEDFASAEDQSLLEDNVDEYTTQKSESEPGYMSNGIRFPEGSYEDAENSVLPDDDRKPEVEFPEVIIPEKPSPTKDDSMKVSVPIVAVIKPPNLNDGKIDSSILAVLPNRMQSDPLASQLNFLTENREKIERDAQDYVDRASIAVDPQNWKFYSTSAQRTETSPSSEETLSMAPLKDQETVDGIREKFPLTPIALPSFEDGESFLPSSKEHLKYPREAEDLDVAEDIIFRPLFRYRQEAQQRSRYRQDENYYRRSNYQRYNPYQNYDYYPRRSYRYRSRYYDDDY